MKEKTAKNVFIKTNGTPSSKKHEKQVRSALEDGSFRIMDRYDRSCDLIVCIGGDGTFLNLIHELDFPKAPIIGVNTGHLGFFQEIEPAETTAFIKSYRSGNYKTQKMAAVDIELSDGQKKYKETGLNEIVVRGPIGKNIHLGLSIGESFIEDFTGDAILVATPAGSTAYNYSLGGSIVDPGLELLQVTPIAPINTVAYRSFTSSIVLPPKGNLGLKPRTADDGDVHVEFDGFSVEYEDIKEMNVKLSSRKITLLRLDSYDFWNKVKSKFL